MMIIAILSLEIATASITPRVGSSLMRAPIMRPATPYRPAPSVRPAPPPAGPLAPSRPAASSAPRPLPSTGSTAHAPQQQQSPSPTTWLWLWWVFGGNHGAGADRDCADTQVRNADGVCEVRR